MKVIYYKLQQITMSGSDAYLKYPSEFDKVAPILQYVHLGDPMIKRYFSVGPNLTFNINDSPLRGTHSAGSVLWHRVFPFLCTDSPRNCPQGCLYCRAHFISLFCDIGLAAAFIF